MQEPLHLSWDRWINIKTEGEWVLEEESKSCRFYAAACFLGEPLLLELVYRKWRVYSLKWTKYFSIPFLWTSHYRRSYSAKAVTWLQRKLCSCSLMFPFLIPLKMPGLLCVNISFHLANTPYSSGLNKKPQILNHHFGEDEENWKEESFDERIGVRKLISILMGF